jgi:hypothetical protein
MARPSAKVRARRRGETPWLSQWAAERFKDAIERPVIMLTLSIRSMRKSGFGVKLLIDEPEEAAEIWSVPILNVDEWARED